MNTQAIQSNDNLQVHLSKADRTFLLIYKAGSEQSDCALERIHQLETGLQEPILTVNVGEVRDIHAQLGVDSAPSLVVFKEGKVSNIVKGCLTEASYASLFAGTSLGSHSEKGESKTRQVTVYTTPTCSWCTTLKTYLDQHAVRYREVNVASDTAAAEAMVRKSGQQGVPQTEINGQMIVGFDKTRINQILELA